MEIKGSGDGPLEDALKECATARFTGVLRVDGVPGGTIHLSGGGIGACDTPGAPSLEVVFLRSQMIGEADWDAAFTSAAKTGRPMADELTERDLVGTGELEALLRTTLADAIFALVSGTVDAWHTSEQPEDCLLPLQPAAKAGWLLAEATRRTQVLASFPEPALDARDRIVAVPGAALDDLALDDVLMLADGRRTARDLAFALGQGLFATMLRLSRMRQDKLITIGSATGPPSPTASSLPHRRKDGAGPRPVQTLRTLRPRTGESGTP